jgi:glucokinase
MGAGTGLGMGGLVPLALPGGVQWAPIPGEGGHLSLAPETELEMAVLRVLQQHIGGRVSLERVLSGPGLVNLLDALEEVMAASAKLTERTAAAIVQAALAGHCPVCVQVLDTFCALLGSAAGDLALLLGARGGIYIGGGIVPRLGDAFDRSPFRARFDDKGRLSTLVREVPVYVIHAEVSPALRGVGQALR